MEKSLENQVVIVTGGGRGIGAACARLFVRAGARVAITSRTASELDAVADSTGDRDRVLPVVTDVCEEQQVKRLFDRVLDTFGDVDVLVNNAGMITVRPVRDLSVRDWDRTLAVNGRGSFLCSRELFGRLAERGHGGSIVNVSSLGAIHGTEKFPGFAAYTAAKYAVVGLTECLAVEGRELGIRVNCVAPGAVDTVMLRQAAPGLRTETTPEDVAKTILFLADDTQSKAVTGAILEIHSNL